MRLARAELAQKKVPWAGLCLSVDGPSEKIHSVSNFRREDDMRCPVYGGFRTALVSECNAICTSYEFLERNSLLPM